MMKNKHKLLLGLAVLIVIAAAAAALILWPQEDAGEPQPSASAQYVLFSADTGDIQSIQLINGGEELLFVNKDDDWEIEGIDPATTAVQKITTFVQTAANITSSHKVADSDDNAEYGLGSPQAELVITAASETAHIKIGGTSPALGEVFVQRDDGAVYTINQNVAESLMQGLDYYRDFNRFVIDAETVTSVTIEREGDSTIALSVREDIGERTYNVWQMTSPYPSVQNANDEYVDDNILSPIGSLSLSELAEGQQITPDRTVTITADGEDIVLRIQRVDDTLSYVEYEGMVYRANTQSLSFAYTDEFNIVSKLALLVDAAEAGEVKVTAGGVQYVLDIQQEDNTFSYTLNGKALDKQDGAALYQELIGLSVDALYNSETLQEPEVLIEFGGAGIKAELSSIDDMRYALTKNGETLFTIRKTKVEEMITAFADNAKEE